MSFASPIGLLALLVIPLGALALWAARARRRRYALRFPAVATVALVLPHSPAWRRWLPTALLGLAAAALALAIAKPQHTIALPVQQASVVLVSDASGSMAATDVQPTRLDAARSAAKTFVNKVPKSLRVGLVGYSTFPHTVLRPTVERDVVETTLDGLVADGGTATGDALASALETLQPTGKAKRPPSAIVLLSDGATTDGQDPVAVAREAAKLKTPIYTVALGTPDGVVPNGIGGFTPVPPDPETLKQIADASGGQAFTAQDADQLRGVYEKLGTQVGTKPAKRELTAGFAGAGLLFLLLSVGAGAWYRGRVI
jgi:Ca-activated chloride channel family protein